MPFFVILSLITASLATSASAESLRRPAILMRDYHGAHEADFASQFDRVRLLAQQAQLEVSARLGLIQYREGFQNPLVIRFQDGAPKNIESALAYVQMVLPGVKDASMANPQQNLAVATFQQELVVNLDAMAANPVDFDTVFYHEMTHAVMNDAVGADAVNRVPRWLQEGLALYVSGEGDTRVKKAAGAYRKSQVGALLLGLSDPVTAAGYPQYYLGVKYILDRATVNALQALVRNLINGKTMEDALQDALGMSLAVYNRNVRDYSQGVFESYAKPDNFVTPSRIKSRLTGFGQ